jgi:transcriptional regulator with XRE-family HTH domain
VTHPRTPDEQTGPGELARQLRAARGAMAQTELAERAGWHNSKVSKIEHGKQIPTPDDLDLWAEHTGADEAARHEWHSLLVAEHEVRRTHAEMLRRGQEVNQLRFSQLIGAATRCRFLDTWVVPRLLQIPAYSRATFSPSPTSAPARARTSIKAVTQRQSDLAYLTDLSRSFEFLITEPVLRWRPRALPREVHRAQLERLLYAVDGLPNVRFGIIPLDADITWWPQMNILILGDVVSMETWLNDITLIDDESVAAAHRVVDQMWAGAATGPAARRLVQDAIERLDHTEPNAR